MSQIHDYFLIECISELNLCIKKPLQQTLRIKYTTFDVSTNYLVFGATSGGIYVFNRSTFEFLKLVPSKEGAIVKLIICPNEKYVIVGTCKGCIILIENCFTDAKLRYQLFGEHEGNLITDLIWHYQEIYCGDNKGKVSVISLNSLLSKAIFQTPTALLMHLEAPIVQLDACGKYLVVSTKNKTYLCDTETEQYRQIGKKLREGDFGACFFAEDPLQFTNKCEKEKARFKILKEDESFSQASPMTTRNAKIFCARPGFRLWEANFAASVVCTYQLKTALAENQTESICLESDVNMHLKTRKMLMHNFDNFSRLQIALQKFLLTYCNNNLVVFDIQGIHLLFVYEMRDIREIKVAQNYIYLWNKKDVRVVALMDLDALLLKVLSAKQYVMCTELCLKYSDRVIKSLEVSNRLQPLEVLKDKCRSKDDAKSLEGIFETIEKFKEIVFNEKEKGKGQIVKVNNGHFEPELQSYVQPSCSYTVDTNYKTRTKVNDTLQIQHETSSTKDLNHPSTDINYVNNILYKQYQVNQLYNHIETAQLTDLLASKANLDDIVTLFNGFIDHVVENNLEREDNNNVLHWCYTQYLKYVNQNREYVKTLDVDSMALKYIFDAFKFVGNKVTHCDCKFPLPVADTNDEYFQLAKDTFYKLAIADREQLLLSVPLLWALKIPELKEPLPLIMQLGDWVLFREHCESFSYDQWSDCVLLLAKLRRGFCVNCERAQKINSAKVFAWREFALIMLKRIGGVDTTKILKKYAKFIPNVELGYEFYQSCLFSAVSKENGKSCDFVTNILTTTRLENQFEDGLRAYLNQKYLGVKDSVDLSNADSNDKRKLKCSLCNLLVKNPILEASTRLSCGHLFHKLCLESINGICMHCVQLPS